MKILMAHYRSAPEDPRSLEADAEDSAGTDGVSLEMMKRMKLLREMGHDVAVVSALPCATYPVPSLEYESSEVLKINRNLFGGTIADFEDERALARAFNEMADRIRQDLDGVFSTYRPDLLLVHNMLCLPVHPAATVALTDLLGSTGCPCSATHHDIVSEGAYKFSSTCELARDLLARYFPPTGGNIKIKHNTINTRNKVALKSRGIDASVVHDSMDFEAAPSDDERERLRKVIREKYGIGPSDVVLLFAARIVSNKQAEIAARLTRAVGRRRHDLAGKRLYNGRTFTDESRIMFIIAGRPERTFLDYRDRLFRLCDELGIDWKYVGGDVRVMRDERKGLFALFPDMYSIADVVLYPSGWEGFGNQLIEAFQNRLPAAVFEYPVFVEDIKPKGFEVISLGSSVLEERDALGLVQVPEDVLERAADEVISVLADPGRYGRMTETNFELGRRCFGYSALRAHLEEVLSWALRFR
jgi:hypothetical protein